jgi:hypothetical protein
MWKVGRAGKTLGIVGLLLCLEARAGAWGSFEAAFPMFPCQDGWMGCLVSGQHVDSELQKDTMGLMVPADARIGWFDLKATAAFSPFPGLSAYEAGGDAVAAAEPGAPPPVEPEDDGLAEADDGRAAEATLVSERAAADADAARASQMEAARAAKEADARRKQADLDAQRQRQEEEAARKEATAAIERAKSANNAAAAEERERLKREADVAAARATELERQRKAADAAALQEKTAQAAAQKKAAEEAERLRQAEAARTAAQQKEAAAIAALKLAEEQKQREADEARRKAEQEAATQAAKVGTPAPAPAAAAVADGDCSDTVKLEPTALLGKLTEGVIGCLETRLANAAKPTDKKKISGILMADAWAKSDKDRWETLIKRHLDEIDQSDPDLCYKYALHLSRQGASRASGVIRWANVALENRTVWVGETYTSRVYSLYKVRAAASQSLWQAAEESHAKSPSDESRENVDKYRNMTKVNAREWYEYAKSAGKDAQTALQLCMSAAGTSDYCQAE